MGHGFLCKLDDADIKDDFEREVKMQNGVLRSDSSPFSGVMGADFWSLI